tara:strand:+ start:45485 stop:45655 length:171 start_codon:yes stop_codon:yes gene_type:complete
VLKINKKGIKKAPGAKCEKAHKNGGSQAQTYKMINAEHYHRERIRREEASLMINSC